MKILRFLIAILVIINIGCKKNDSNNAGTGIGPINGNGPLRLTSVKSDFGTVHITYNADGTIKGMPDSTLKYFNNGLLLQYVSGDDTVILDSINRLLYYKTFFDNSDRNLHLPNRQTAHYIYDNLNRVIRTVTNTGDGLDYLQELTYENGDVVDMVYNIAGYASNTEHFTYTFYDTPCVDQYLGIIYWAQIGMTQNRHLLKSESYEGTTTYYSYVLDSDNRVLISYRDYDNSAWTYARAVDTSYYTYTCQ